MKTRKLFIISMFAFLLGTSSCITDIVDGNGYLVEESRITTDFSRVKSSGSFDVYITKGVETDVIVSAEENLLQYIETYVSNDVLHIDIENHISIRPDLPIEIYVSTPELEGLKLSGSGKIDTDHFDSREMDILLSGSGKIYTSCNADEVDILVSGSGKVVVSGNTQKADFDISGSGKVDASNLSSESCYSTISGSGDVWISVEKYLKARISGSGNVYYYGQPELDKKISGSGNVLRQK